MLKPVTKEEKLEFTLCIQADKAKDEIFWELMDKNYSGFVDIWPSISRKKGQVVLEVMHKEIKTSDEVMSHKEATRYHVVPGKGVKKIK
jgi:hypothetical protein